MITTIGVFTTHASAESALHELKQFGVPETDLSYIYRTDHGDMKDAQTGQKIGEGAATGATTGAIIGGIAGLVVANGILPGLGTLFVAGPLAAALGLTGAVATTAAAAATGAAAGGLIGAFTHLGIDEKDVELYQNHVRTGDIVVTARNTPESTQDVFLNNGALEVRQYTSSS